MKIADVIVMCAMFPVKTEHVIDYFGINLRTVRRNLHYNVGALGYSGLVMTIEKIERVASETAYLDRATKIADLIVTGFCRSCHEQCEVR